MNNYKLKIFLSFSAVTFFTAAFFYNPQAIVSGVSRGLSLCGSSVIPPLFPFMFLADFLLRSGLCGAVGRYLNRATKLLFNLSGDAGCAVAMSMVGGYPVGAKMISELIDNGNLSVSDGRRMLLFCVNPGPAFVIGTVGSVMLSSRKAGVILYASMVLSAAFIGILTRFFTKDEVATVKIKKEVNLSIVSESVTAATNTVIMLCGWVLLFSCVNSLIKELPFKDNTVVWFSILNEVTSGSAAALKAFPISVQALVMGWAGLSVHCQLLPFIKKTEIKGIHYLLSRIVHGGLATAIATVLFKIFPCEVQVFASASQILPQAFSVSAPAAVAMLCLCSFLILDILPNKNRMKRI